VAHRERVDQVDLLDQVVLTVYQAVKTSSSIIQLRNLHYHINNSEKLQLVAVNKVSV
jgi:hypothetical protein